MSSSQDAKPLFRKRFRHVCWACGRQVRVSSPCLSHALWTQQLLPCLPAGSVLVSTHPMLSKRDERHPSVCDMVAQMHGGGELYTSANLYIYVKVRCVYPCGSAQCELPFCFA